MGPRRPLLARARDIEGNDLVPNAIRLSGHGKLSRGALEKLWRRRRE